MPQAAEELSSMPPVKSGTQIIGIAEPFGGWVNSLAPINAAPHYQASIEGVETPLVGKVSSGQYAESDGVSLFNFERFGHLAPSFGWVAMADSGNFMTETPINGGMTPAKNITYGACVLKNARIVQFDASGLSTQAKYDPTSHTPVATGNGDMIVFRDYQSTPIEWIVYSWDYSSGSEVSLLKSSDFTTHTDGWYSGSISGVQSLVLGVPHKIWVGPDGNIYITNGPAVQQIVVPAATALTSATNGNLLEVGSGWTVMGGCSFKNYSAIIAMSANVTSVSRGSVRVFLWDGTQTTANGVTTVAPQYIYDIPDNFANAIYFDGNTLLAMTNGRNNSFKMWELSGTSGFKKVFETQFMSPPLYSMQGNIDIMQDSLFFGMQKGDLYAHLFRYFGGGFHDEGYIARSELSQGLIATEIFMVKNLFEGLMFVGGHFASEHAIYVSQPGTYLASTLTGTAATINFRSILYTTAILGRRAYPMGFKMTINRMKIYLSQWSSSSSLLISIFKNYDAWSPGGATDQLDLTLDTNTGTAESINHHAFPAGTLEMDISDFAITDVSTFYLNVRWTHPSMSSTPAVIRRIELYVDPSQ